jgi:nitrate reductase gamma subunit
MAFHICILLLIIGHLELFGEIETLQFIPHEIFLGQGLVGLIASIALLYFLFRRFISPVRELSVPEDYYLLILLFLVVLFGSQMDWARRWYFYEELSVDHYREYLSSLLYYLFLMFFPFSQLMHSFLSLPMNKLRRG